MNINQKSTIEWNGMHGFEHDQLNGKTREKQVRNAAVVRWAGTKLTAGVCTPVEEARREARISGTEVGLRRSTC